MEQQSSSSSAADVSVRVAVRVRGLLPKELTYGAQSCINVNPVTKCVSVGTNRRFTFDHTFDASSTQEDVYNCCVASLVDSCFQGYNATVLAYGQTGSGKTHTMGTSNLTMIDASQEGVAPRVIRQLYEGMAARKDHAAFQVRAQFLEIHNEELRDLLHPDIPQKALAIRETAEGGIMVTGAKETVALSCQHLLHLLDAGSFARSTGRTLLNEHSSRSHAIFTVIVEQHIFGNQQVASSGAEYRCAKFHLVDLAGSERTKRSGAVGMRFKETVNINQGLLALGNVISALGDERKRSSHVPYRDSRLTRLLQDSLGGNSQTCMIACISSADDSLDETMNTLKYANRARNIQNKPIVNREQKHTSEALQEEAQALKLAILKQAIERPGCIQLSELLLADLTNPTAATLQHLQQLAFQASQQSGQDPHLSQGELEAKGLEALQEENAYLRLQLQDAQASQELMTQEAEALLAVHRQLQQRASTPNAVAAAVHALVPNLVASGHMTSEAQSVLLQCVSAPEQCKTLLNMPVGPLLHNDPEEFNSANSSTGQAPAEAARASLHSHPLLAMSVARSGVTDMVHQQFLRASTIDQVRHLELKLQEAALQLAEKDEALMAAREDLQQDEVIFASKLAELQNLQAELQEVQAKYKTAIDGQEQREQNLVTELEHWRTKALLAEEQLSSFGQARPFSSLAGQNLLHADLTASGCSTGTIACDDQVIYDDELLSYISETDYTDMQRSVVWPEPDPVLQEQLQRATAERLAAEEQRQAAEVAAAEKETQYALAREALNAQLQDLTDGIKGKEAVIAQLVAAEADARAHSEQLLARMQQLELDIHSKQVELGSLQQELQDLEASARQRSKEEQDALRQKYEDHIKAAEAQMSQLKQQLHGQEMIQANKERQRSKARIQHLQDDLAKMQTQHDDLRKNLRLKSNSHERQVFEQQKEIATMRRAAELAHRKLKELEASNAKQKQTIKNMQLDAAAAKRKSRASDDSRILLDKIKNSAGLLGKGMPGQAVASSLQPQQQQWVEKQLRVIMQHNDAQTRLDMLQAKKADLKGQQKDLGCQAARHQLQNLRNRVDADASLKQAVSSRATHMSSCEAADTEDLLDSISVELEYITQQESEAQEVLLQSQRAWEALKRRAAGMTTREAQAAVAAAISLLVDQSESQRTLQAQLAEAEGSLQQVALQLETTQLAVQAKDQDTEQRLQEVQAEHSHKVQTLLRQIKHLLMHEGTSAGGQVGEGLLAHPLSVTSSMALDSLNGQSKEPSKRDTAAGLAIARLHQSSAQRQHQPLPALVSRHLQMRRSQPAGLGPGPAATAGAYSAGNAASRQAANKDLDRAPILQSASKHLDGDSPLQDDEVDLAAHSRVNSDSDSSPTKDQPSLHLLHRSSPGRTAVTSSRDGTSYYMQAAGLHNGAAAKVPASVPSGRCTSTEEVHDTAVDPHCSPQQSVQIGSRGAVVQTSAINNESLRQQLSPYKKLLRQSASFAQRSPQAARRAEDAGDAGAGSNKGGTPAV